MRGEHGMGLWKKNIRNGCEGFSSLISFAVREGSKIRFGMILGVVILLSRRCFLHNIKLLLTRRLQCRIFQTALMAFINGMSILLELPRIGKLELFLSFSAYYTLQLLVL